MVPVPTIVPIWKNRSFGQSRDRQRQPNRHSLGSPVPGNLPAEAADRDPLHEHGAEALVVRNVIKAPPLSVHSSTRSALSKEDVTRVGIEATGGYERGVVRHLRLAGFTVLVLQPMQVKAYARLHLRRAKNDAIDATLITACASVMALPEIASDERLAELAGHLTFVEQTEEDIPGSRSASSRGRTSAP